MEVFKVNNIKDFLDGFTNLFDIVRVVDPRRRTVIYQNGYGEPIIHGHDCYEFWARGKSCDNCISSQAYKDKRTFTKIEYVGDRVYIVMTSPITIEDDLYVLEILKDITENGIITGISRLSNIETNDIISELNEKIIRDDLTGAYNRRYINQKLPIDLDYGISHKEKLTVIMLDIDNFKEINDTYGHVAGDLVLKELVRTVSSKIRANYDWISRYGGDEFLIALKKSNEEVAMKVMKEIQKSVENINPRIGNGTINITISMGSYTVKSMEKDIEMIIREADKNLKKAKDNGKNMIVAS